MSHARRAARPRSLTLSLLLTLTGCGSAAGEDATVGFGEARLELGECAETAAGQGWLNTASPAASGIFTASFRSAPKEGAPGSGPIDAVIGLSAAPASRFADLAAIVRFNESGAIDARNGAAYGGPSFPYTFAAGQYDFQLRVDVPRGRYSAWVRHLDSPYKPFELLAEQFAFRSEQSTTRQLANVALFVDSAHGSLQTCGLAQDPPDGCVAAGGGGGWASRSLTPSGVELAGVDFHAWVDQPGIDAVIGVSAGAPGHFRDLGAIVRFRPDGYLDARNGSVYAADASLPYQANRSYRFTLELDSARSRYSVVVTSGSSAVTLARDYAFRSEQAGVRDFSHLGQLVDGGSGAVHTCAVVAR